MIDQESFTILIVDDEKPNILTLTHSLQPMYTTLSATDGQRALEIAHSHLPDLILLDIMMPDMDGFEVMHQLQRSQITRHIPVIFITGLNTAEGEETGLSLGAVDYIMKPFHHASVLARIKKHLGNIEYMRKIERLSKMDVLTNIANRRGFESRLNLEWTRARQEHTPISVLMIDVDQFKAYNDTYGHLQGDVALRIIVEGFLKILKRSVDFVARWGGEEFAVLLPNTEISGAMVIAGQLRADIENLKIPHEDGTTTYVTISIGVATMIPGTTDTTQELVLRADQALYNAKTKGRNMVCAYDAHAARRRSDDATP